MFLGERLGCHGECSRKMLVFPRETGSFPREGHVFSREVPECSLDMLVYSGELLGYS